MINNIKKSKFPNNIYLEVEGIGWKYSDEIMPLTTDHELGSYVVFEIFNEKKSNDYLRLRFVKMYTYEEIARLYNVSSSTVSKKISKYIIEIKNSNKYKKMITKGYNYFKDKMK